MKIFGGVNLEFLIKEYYPEKITKSGDYEKQLFSLRGGSGSAKTTDSISFLIYVLKYFRNKKLNVLIVRETYAQTKGSVLRDFIKSLERYNIYDQKKHVKSHPQSYNLYGNNVQFNGLDGMTAHGQRNDIVWFNEIMSMDYKPVSQMMMRTNMINLFDYNPSEEEHWVYNKVETRNDCKCITTTQLDNTFLPDGQRKEILLLEPTQENILSGTADAEAWGIYGKGEISLSKKRVFNNILVCNSIPFDYDYRCYGIDWGYGSSPMVCVELTYCGTNLYLRSVVFERGITNQPFAERIFYHLAKNYLLENGFVENDSVFKSGNEYDNIKSIENNFNYSSIEDYVLSFDFIADNAEPRSIQMLCDGYGDNFKYALNVIACKKRVKGYSNVKYEGVKRLKSYKLHILPNKDESLTYKENPTLLKSFRSFQHQMKNGEAVLSSDTGFERFLKKDDDGVDATLYGDQATYINDLLNEE